MTSARRGATARPAGAGRDAPKRPGAARRTTPPTPPTPPTVLDLTTNPPAAPGQVPPVRTPVMRSRVTGRAAVLLLILGMLAVAYAWPLREYVRQRSELATLRAATAREQAQVDALEAAKARWADPAYIEAQARGRLHYVMPGEVAFTVVHPGQSTLVKTLPRTPPRTQAWYDALWTSLQGADNPAAHARKP